MTKEYTFEQVPTQGLKKLEPSMLMAVSTKISVMTASQTKADPVNWSSILGIQGRHTDKTIIWNQIPVLFIFSVVRTSLNCLYFLCINFYVV